jgi:sphinganine C4-monooxygenase
MFQLSDVVAAVLPVATFWTTVAWYTWRGMAVPADEPAAGSPTIGDMSLRMLQINLLHIVSTLANIGVTNFLSGSVQPGFSFRWWTVPIGVVAMDTIQYICHRTFHTFPSLYRFHKVHHESKALHSVGALYNSFFEVVCTGAAMGILFYNILGFQPFEFAVLSSLSFIQTIREHTPALGKTRHWVHHNPNIHANFQQPFFSYWDRLLGTYQPPPPPETIRMRKTEKLRKRRSLRID